MNEYKKYITNLAKERSNTLFINSGPEHAAIVIASMFKTAKEEVSMFCGDLNGDVSTQFNYILALRSFLQKGGTWKVLLEEYDENDMPNIFHFIPEFIGTDQVQVKHTHTRVKDGNQNFVHFLVADKRMYRIENDTKKYLAKGNFNDPDTSLRLNTLYDDIFENHSSELLRFPVEN